MTKLVTLAVVLAACGKSGSDAKSDKPSPSPSSASADDKTPMCDRKLVTAEDLAGLLPAAITSTEVIGDDGCNFSTGHGGSSVLVRYRRTMGKLTIKGMLDGSMNVKAEPLAGVGDSAVWVKELMEVDATKGDALCAVSFRGTASADLAAKLGAICTKVYAKTGS